ncbi:DUF5330 domain-containing protein [Mesorhizobium marinum]|uniref:DUF5330 domain-containing protein n=1 Tax=Mesorhizobium marinum TaxID=3228790 RepID=A0ABV3R1L3_9HYPH
MGFLIRMAFWFSLVLLALPLDPAGENGATGVNPIQAFFAAKEAVDDVAGICERKPGVCEVGKAAMHTIGVRAREGARIAYEMLEDNGAGKPAPDEIGALIATGEAAPLAATDAGATGSVTPVN